MRFLPWLFAFSFLLVGCSSYRELTDIPDRSFAVPGTFSSTGEINFRVTTSTTALKSSLQDLKKLSFSVTEPEQSKLQKITLVDNQRNPLYDPKKWLITKNPTYNPSKWLKTRNPTYNKKKWIKVCVFGKCAKTKNPLYDPKKWIKTKNPAYDPRKTIKTKNPAYSPNKEFSVVVPFESVQGFSLFANIDEVPTYEPFGLNKARIEIPISLQGYITVMTAFTPTLIRAPFDGRVILTTDIELRPREDWCMEPKASVKFRWDKDLKLDVTHGAGILQVNLSDLADSELDKLAKQISKEIQNSANCELQQKSAKSSWRTLSIAIDENSQLIAVPKEAYLSAVTFEDNKISVGGKFASDLTIIPADKEVPQAPDLPELKLMEIPDVPFDLKLPLGLDYDWIKGSLQKFIDDIDDGSDFSKAKNNGQLQIKVSDIYPSENSLAIGLAFKSKSKIPFASVAGKAFIKTSLSFVKDDNSGKHTALFDVEKLSFSSESSMKDLTIIWAAYNALKDKVEAEFSLDIDRQVKDSEAKIREVASKFRNTSSGNEDELSVQIVLGDFIYAEKEVLVYTSAIAK